MYFIHVNENQMFITLAYILYDCAYFSREKPTAGLNSPIFKEYLRKCCPFRGNNSIQSHSEFINQIIVMKMYAIDSVSIN